jgi:hypothetical protein
VLGPVTGLLNDFVSSAPTDPSHSFGLLVPALQVGGLAGFRRVWRNVRRATVGQVTPESGTAVRADVTFTCQDGRRVHTEQRFVMSGGPQPRIADIEVLSVRSD